MELLNYTNREHCFIIYEHVAALILSSYLTFWDLCSEDVYLLWCSSLKLLFYFLLNHYPTMSENISQRLLHISVQTVAIFVCSHMLCTEFKRLFSCISRVLFIFCSLYLVTIKVNIRIVETSHHYCHATQKSALLFALIVISYLLEARPGWKARSQVTISVL